MKANSRSATIFTVKDHRPLVLLVIGLLVVLLHLCQFPPVTEKLSSRETTPVVFVWQDNHAGEGLYRLPATTTAESKKINELFPNRLRPLFFQAINVNRADRELLSTLPGIGPVLAERIVHQRETRGNFHSPSDLLEVTGLGEGKLEKIRNLLVFEQ